jgi:hypothetical protein
LQMPIAVEPLCALLRDPDLTVQSKARLSKNAL